MKGIATLIKLHRRTLDGLRRKMAALEGQKSQLQALSAKLLTELNMELDLASRKPELGNFFGDFAKRIRMRREQIAAEIATLDKQMAKLREEITVAFSEVKKFEIAQENAKRREKEKQNRRDTILLDEIAGQQHQRNQDT